MVGNYAVLAERISSLSSLSRLHDGFNPNILQFTRQHPYFSGAAIKKNCSPFFSKGMLELCLMSSEGGAIARPLHEIQSHKNALEIMRPCTAYCANRPGLKSSPPLPS